MSAARYKELLHQRLTQAGLPNLAEVEALMEEVFAAYSNRSLTRITTEQLAAKLGLVGRVSVARQLLAGLGERAKMDPLSPGTPLSHTYWTVEQLALDELIAEATREH